MTETLELGDLSKFASGFKPKEILPAEFLYQVHPKVKTTQLMAEVQSRYEAPVGAILSWLFKEKRRSIASISRELGVSRYAVRTWIRKFDIKRKPQAA